MSACVRDSMRMRASACGWPCLFGGMGEMGGDDHECDRSVPDTAEQAPALRTQEYIPDGDSEEVRSPLDNSDLC